MTKNVKITVNGIPITSISTPLTMGTHGPVMLDTKDIFKCIIAGARVVEVFEGYGEVVLTLSNYDSDNTPYMKAAAVKSVMDEMKASADHVHIHQSETESESFGAQEAFTETEEAAEVESGEEVEDPTQENEEPKTPEHWMPPQRDNNGAKNNNRNNGNKGKRK